MKSGTAPVRFEEGELRTRDGLRLFFRTAAIDGPCRSDVVLAHGMGEHSSRYLHVAEALAARGHRLCAFDMRGHGRSEGRRGWTPSYEHLLDDLALVIARFRSPERPLFLHAHSTGGQIAINLLLRGAPSVQGLVLTSPLLRLAFRPAWVQRALASAALRVFPGFTQTTRLVPEKLSRDVDFLFNMPDLDLTHRKMSALLYALLMRRGEAALEGAAKITTPFLLLHGDADQVTSHRASEVFFDRAASTDKMLRIFPAHRHELHNDLERDRVLAEIGDWLDARS